MDKRRCEFKGCKAWARRGMVFCVAHPDGRPRRVGGAPKGNQNARKHGVYATYVPIAQARQALELPPGDLRLEIALVRQALAQALAADLPPAPLITAVCRATSALVRMLKANKQLSVDAAGELDTAVDQYLREIGLGGGVP